jgi:hypothetical protein
MTTEVPTEHENALFDVAPPAAPLQPTAVWDWSDAARTQALSPHRASRDSGTAWATYLPRLWRSTFADDRALWLQVIFREKRGDQEEVSALIRVGPR